MVVVIVVVAILGILKGTLLGKPCLLTMQERKVSLPTCVCLDEVRKDLFVPSYGLQGTYPAIVRIYGYVVILVAVFHLLEGEVDIVPSMDVIEDIGFLFRSFVFTLGCFRLVGTRIFFLGFGNLIRGTVFKGTPIETSQREDFEEVEDS